MQVLFFAESPEDDFLNVSVVDLVKSVVYMEAHKEDENGVAHKHFHSCCGSDFLLLAVEARTVGTSSQEVL